MHLTIERLRSLVVAAAVLLLAATIALLAVGKWRRPLNRRDMPSKLGLEIEQESNGVTFSHALGGHSQFKIHAAKVVQLRQGTALLSDVKIELYGQDGRQVDRIEGASFEYDEKKCTATAAGPVEITLMRPGEAPAIAPKAAPGSKNTPLNAAARAAAAGQAHVKTSGLSFNWTTGLATTDKRVDFTTTQGTGSSLGAIYDAKAGRLVLTQQVEVHTTRAGEPVELRAAHAEFDRTGLEGQMRQLSATYNAGQATAAEAQIEFREDGSAEHLEATGGFEMRTAQGGKVRAPRGRLEFNAQNQPQHGHLEGGVELDSYRSGRHAQGKASAANLEFTGKGDLRHAHLEGGVELASEEQGLTAGAHAEPIHARRTWRSQTAEIDFRKAAQGGVEPAQMEGSGVGGVTMTSRVERGKSAPTEARMTAERVNGSFGAAGALSQLTGVGHATMEQTLTSGARQKATGERLEAHFATAGTTNPGGVQMQSAVLDGHVALVQRPESKRAADAPLHAFAGHAVYAGDGQWLHLSQQPRIDNGGLQLTADRIDVSQESGDAFAHGNVKATWLQTTKSGRAAAEEPAHVISAEAQLHQMAGNVESTATFRGRARLWQGSNTISAPTIVLEKKSQRLEASSTERSEPVRVVLLNQGSGQNSGHNGHGGKTGGTGPAVIRVRGGLLHYAGLERTATIEGGGLGAVVAESGTTTSQSNQVELRLTPTGAAAPGPTGQVERMTARGHVVLLSEGRRGTGEQLVYTGANGQYVLTGSASTLPRISDPLHGTASGKALIFRSRDDSVSIEGGGRTQTTAPR